MRSRIVISSLDNLITESIWLDNKLYEFNLESRSFTWTKVLYKNTRYYSN
jgi:hypothetical protein